MKTFLSFLYLTCLASATRYRRIPANDGMTCELRDTIYMIKAWSPILCCAICKSNKSCTNAAFNGRKNICVGCSASSTMQFIFKDTKYYSPSETTVTALSVTTTEIITHTDTKKSTSTSTKQTSTSSTITSITNTGTVTGDLLSSPKSIDVESTPKQTNEIGWYSYFGDLYRFFNTKLKRNKAAEFCRGESGRRAFLVTIEDSEKNEFVKELAFKQSTDHLMIHIGLRMNGKSLVEDLHGTPMDYHNFLDLKSVAEAVDECVYMMRSGEWVTLMCNLNDAMPFVCQAPNY